MRGGPGWFTWYCHMVPHGGSSILQPHLFISQGNTAFLQLLEPYGMECPDGLPAIQLHVSHPEDVVSYMATQTRSRLIFLKYPVPNDEEVNTDLIILGRPSCRSIDNLM